MKKTILLLTAFASLTIASYAGDKTDAQLRQAIESQTWYSARHGYRFAPNGRIVVDGYTTSDERWRIRDGLLYRMVAGQTFPPTKIIEINDRQLVEQEISGSYSGAVEVMYSNR